MYTEIEITLPPHPRVVDKRRVYDVRKLLGISRRLLYSRVLYSQRETRIVNVRYTYIYIHTRVVGPELNRKLNKRR